MSETTPTLPKRNADGLYDNVKYVYREDGKIDWLRMISPEYFVPNRDRTNETDVSKLRDEDKLILLQGFRELADLRGYKSVSHKTVHADTQLVTVETTIVWRGNYETSGDDVSFTAMADAHDMNTKSFAVNFLASIAENRGFVRAVKGFLKIPVLAKDELGNAALGDDSNMVQDVHRALIDLLDQNKIKFESFQNRMTRMQVSGAEDWKSMADVPAEQVAELIVKVKQALQERAEKQQQQATK